MPRHNEAVLHAPGTLTTLLRVFFHLSHAHVYQRVGVSDRCDIQLWYLAWYFSYFLRNWFPVITGIIRSKSW